jgi:regulator of protease activity HflC (stomatin/prohibitin superfamily)
MLAQLFSFIAQFWRLLLPWVVLDAEQVGFVRRLGVPHRTLKPGLTWKMPLLEHAEVEDSRCYVYILDPQSLRTADGEQVVLRISVCTRVVDARKYFLEVYDGRSNVQDVACGELAEAVQGASADDVLSGAVLAPVLRRVRAQARRWGMRVDSVKFVDATRARSLRLWQSNFTSAGQD